MDRALGIALFLLRVRMKIPIAFVGNLSNPTVCNDCKGTCCKTAPGIFLPSDLGAPDEKLLQENIKRLLDSGLYTIDWWDGDPRPGHDDGCNGYYLRPAIKGAEGRRSHPSYGGQCTLLGENGCSLRSEDRPTQCRGLLPAEDYFTNPREATCRGYATEDAKRSYAIAWIPYRRFLI